MSPFHNFEEYRDVDSLRKLLKITQAVSSRAGGQNEVVSSRGPALSFGPCWFTDRVPYVNSKGRLKREAHYSSLVGGRFNKQGNLHMRLVLDYLRTSKSPHLRARILKDYIVALTGFGHITSTDDLNNTLLSQGCGLGTAPTVGVAGRACFTD